MSQLNYNILIPHKNDPKRLQRCLCSIPKRDDLRIIIVDDNSDPAIVDFDHFPGIERNDVEIIFDKVGGGAGHARNVGLKHVNAEKLINADADDFFTYCFNDVLDEYANDDSDIIFLNACAIEEGTYLYSNRCAYKNIMIKGYLEGDSKYNELLLRYDDGSPCCKIIKRSLIDEQHIGFEEVPIHDDVRFCYMIGHYAKSIKVDKRAIYCISYSPTSVSFSMSEEKYITRMHVIGERDQFVRSLGVKLACTGEFLQQTLLELSKSNNMDLYWRCLDILQNYGFNKDTMHRKVRKLQRKEHMNHWKTIIKRYIYFMSAEKIDY